MKALFFVFALVIGTTTWAGPPPQQQQEHQDQQEHQEQDYQQCPGYCEPPQPQLSTCHARMVDCYGRTINTYWGRAPQYQDACQFAINHCIGETTLGYGGAGARCYISGK